jgi:hypothetical protein
LGAALALLVLAPGPAPAAAANAPYVLPFTTVHTFRAKANGVSYSLYIRVPPQYTSDTTSYPVIYMLDADYAFPVAVNIVDLLARRLDQAPHAVMVAVGYAGQHPNEEKYRLNRTRDYTPAPMAGASPEAQKNSGGAAKFLRVLEREVMAFVESNYRVDADNRTLVGHSYGGLFASWVLQERPALFRRYLIVSPSLWYNDELILQREQAGGMPPVPDRTLVYMAVGSDENPRGGAQMVDELNRFAKLLHLRRDPNLVVRNRVFLDETHASVFPIAFSTGVRHLFGEMDNRRPRELAVGTGQ